MLGSQYVIHTTDRRQMGCRLHQLGVVLGLVGYAAHYVDETVERLLRLVLRGFYHEALMEQQGKIDGRRMVAVIQQTLRNVHRRDARRLVLQTVEWEVHRRPSALP